MYVTQLIEESHFVFRAVGCIVGEATAVFLFLCYIILFWPAGHALTLLSMAFMSAADFRRLSGGWALDMKSERLD